MIAVNNLNTSSQNRPQTPPISNMMPWRTSRIIHSSACCALWMEITWKTICNIASSYSGRAAPLASRTLHKIHSPRSWRTCIGTRRIRRRPSRTWIILAGWTWRSMSSSLSLARDYFPACSRTHRIAWVSGRHGTRADGLTSASINNQHRDKCERITRMQRWWNSSLI